MYLLFQGWIRERVRLPWRQRGRLPRLRRHTTSRKTCRKKPIWRLARNPGSDFRSLYTFFGYSYSSTSPSCSYSSTSCCWLTAANRSTTREKVSCYQSVASRSQNQTIHVLSNRVTSTEYSESSLVLTMIRSVRRWSTLSSSHHTISCCRHWTCRRCHKNNGYSRTTWWD